MDIGWYRDVIICIYGVVGTVALIMIVVLIYKLHSRIKSILDSAKHTAGTIDDITTYVGNEAVKPMVQIVALVQGVRQGINTFSNLFHKRKGGKDVR